MKLYGFSFNSLGNYQRNQRLSFVFFLISIPNKITLSFSFWLFVRGVYCLYLDISLEGWSKQEAKESWREMMMM